jgi:O-antigen ligase
MRFIVAGLLALGLAGAQILIGGTRLLYSIPACVVLALAALVGLGVDRSPGRSVRGPGVLVATLFAGYIVIRIAFSPVVYLARSDWFIVMGALVAYLTAALFLVRSKDRMPVIATLLLLAVAHAAIGAIQFKEGNQFMLLPWVGRLDKLWRASGFYISPNHYAGMLEVVAVLALGVACWSKLRLAFRFLAAYVALCCVIGLLLSGSRGGYLSLSFGLVVFVTLSLASLRKTAPRMFFPGLISALVALGIFATMVWAMAAKSPVLSARMGEINDPKNVRLLLWRAALAQFELNPVWGTGSGTYLYFGRQFRDPTIQNDPIYVHNDYLQLLAEYGVVGTALGAVFLLVHTGLGLKNIRGLALEELERPGIAGTQLGLQIGAVSAVAAYAAHSAVDFNLHIPANAWLMGFVFGIIANPGIATARNARTGGVLRRGFLGISTIAALAVLIHGVPKLPGEWWAEKARTAIRDKRLADAREAAARGLRTEKRNPDLFYYAGESAREMFVRSKDPASPLGAEAVAHFKAGLEQFPSDVRLLVKLAQAHDNLRQFELADEALERAAELDPNSGVVHAFYGAHYHAQGFLEEAEASYKAALELLGRNEMALAGFEEISRILAAFRAPPGNRPAPKPVPLPAEPEDPAMEGEKEDIPSPALIR